MTTTLQTLRDSATSVVAIVALLACTSSSVRAQDSVAAVPGGNDALGAHDLTSQRVRYTVDLTPLTTSWGNPILVGPISKATRDLGATYRTQVVGSIGVSPTLARNLAFPAREFLTWTTPGAGPNPTANTPPSTVSSSAFATQFAVGLSDFALAPSTVIGLTIGREPGAFSRLLVQRTVACASRPSATAPDTCTLSLGATDALGGLAVRADFFNTAATTFDRVLGDNILRIDALARSASINALSAPAGVNVASDPASTGFILSNEPIPSATPVLIGSAPAGALWSDFASRLRAGSPGDPLLATTSHLPAGITAHRGNASFSPVTPLGGSAGTISLIGIASGSTIPNRLIACGMNAPSVGTAPTIVPGSPRAFTLPSPISVPGFTANTAANAAFSQYLSQTPFRGGNGQVGIGTNSLNQLVLASVATDPAQGNFIAVATAPTIASQQWTIAAYPGAPVTSGPSGPTVGAIAPNATFSAPAVDRFANIYFVATWIPSGGSTNVGLFKAVHIGTGYKLERLLATGQQILGQNSGRAYVVSNLTLADSDSIASGTLFSGSIIQDRDPAALGFAPTSIRCFGGLAVAALLTYDNAGTPEQYDSVLYVGPAAGLDCPADANNSGTVTVQDIFDFLAAWFAGEPRSDINFSGTITVQDIFDYLSAWFAGC